MDKYISKSNMTTFIHNLKELSVSKEESYIKEWIIEAFIKKEKPYEDRCICSRKIKNIYVLRNIHNGNFVQMGTSCILKLNDEYDSNNSKIYLNKKAIDKKIIKCFQEGVFVPISNLHQYSIDVINEYLETIDAEDLYDFYEKYKCHSKLQRIVLTVKMKMFDLRLESNSEWIDIIKNKNISQLSPIENFVDDEYDQNGPCDSCGINGFRDNLSFNISDDEEGNICIGFCDNCRNFYDICDRNDKIILNNKCREIYSFGR